jgi:hypothetical protein
MPGETLDTQAEPFVRQPEAAGDRDAEVEEAEEEK